MNSNEAPQTRRFGVGQRFQREGPGLPRWKVLKPRVLKRGGREKQEKDPGESELGG